MANFPPYQYQPQMGNFGQQMQPVYQSQGYQFPQAQQTAEQPLFCRMATNREEVQAYPVDFSGRPMTFLGPGMQTIWVKAFNPNTGGSDVIEYRMAATVKPEAAKSPSMDDFLSLRQLVEQQGDEIAKLRGAARRRSNRDQEVTDDEV